MTPELVFLIEEAPEGGLVAQAMGHSIYTEADTWHELYTALHDAITCHFGEKPRPIIVAFKRYGD